VHGWGQESIPKLSVTSIQLCKETKTVLKNKVHFLGMVAHICNPSYLGGGDRRIGVQGQVGKKCEILSEKQTKSKRAVCMPHMVDAYLARSRH
jgi:hypothetical protein